jgi:hypothetical protein
VIAAIYSSTYHEALVTPGTTPLWAFSRKQIRHIANFRKKPRGRPQTLQRLCLRTENFGTRVALTIMLVFAIYFPFCSGKPIAVKNSEASSSVLAVVTMVISIPRVLSILS